MIYAKIQSFTQFIVVKNYAQLNNNNQYANVSKLKIGKERSKRRMVMNRLARYRKEEEDFGREITWEELTGALSQMDERKKGGVDEVEVAMLKRLGMKMMELWRKIFNKSMTEGLVLGKWKKAEMIPLLKDGKDPKDPGSYRPVSLTSAVVKWLERVLVNRMYFWMERDKVINNWQAGFQRGRGTEEQVLRMVQDIQDGHEERGGHERTLVVTLDCSKAYDRVDRVRLIERMMDEGMPGPLVRWYSSFLEGRQARVRMGNGRSNWRRLQQGVPQGAVSSPSLFLLYVNEWNTYMENGIRYSRFSDDIALWARGKKVTEMKDRMQKALNKVGRWTEKNKILVNPTKSESCLYTRNAVEKGMEMGLKILEKIIPTSAIFLGDY